MTDIIIYIVGFNFMLIAISFLHPVRAVRIHSKKPELSPGLVLFLIS